MKTADFPNTRYSPRERKAPIDNPDLIEFGRNIQVWRERIGMTQEELGMEIGADKGKISRYESGQMVMKVDRLFRIAEVLQVPLGELCPKCLCRQEQTESRLYQLAKMIQNLPAEKQNVFFHAAEAMAIGFQSTK